MADELKTDYDAASLLAEVNKAIVAVTAGGQSYKIGSRSLTRANITELRNLRAELAAQVANSADGTLLGNTYAAFFDGR
jgi:hypothetical protein